MESNTADEAADRALSSVNRKLDKSLSVEYTVNQLVADAMDSVNLSHMYSGGAISNFMSTWGTYDSNRMGTPFLIHRCSPTCQC